MANKQICTCCGKDKRIGEYYTSNSPFHKNTGRLHVCKSCIWELSDGITPSDIDRAKDVLRRIDRPFLNNLWQSSIDESERDSKDLFRIYIKNVSMPQYRESTWADSDFTTETLDFDSSGDIDGDELDELIEFFGKGFAKEDYLWLQNEYTDFLNRYECDSKGMELLIKEICLTQLDIQIRRANKEKVDQQLKTLQDLLGSSNLKPVQETGANAVEQESFGTLIKKFEREKPIPEPDEKWKDVDGIGKYIRTFFFGHMARAVGAENRFQDEYEDELAKYTVNQDDVESEQDV